jgi:transposase
MSTVNLREDLKSDPKYLNEVIKVMDSSLSHAQLRIKELEDLIDNSSQNELIELQDKIAMLNKHAFGGSESLNKHRPRRETQRELLTHNKSPLEGEVAPDKHRELPIVEVVHEEACCPGCDSPDFEEITGLYEESVEIDLQAQLARVLKHKRKKYRCKTCESIVTAKGPVKLRPKNKYSLDSAINIAVEKFDYHTPLERIMRKLQEQGLKIDTKTLFSQTEALYLNLAPIMELIKEEILRYGYVHIDETRGKILSTNTNGYIWAMGNCYGAYFQYETTRSGEVALEMLGSFKGCIISDGFSGYNRFKKTKEVRVCHCWSHVRRKFFECLQNYPKAEKALILIDEMFRIERKSKGSFKRLKSLRTKKSKKIHEELFELLLKFERDSLPRSGLGKAVAYTLNLWEGLSEFLDDPYIPMTNNMAERVLRNPVKGRDNYLGFRTINGADVAMFFYTVIETCKILKLNPRRFLKDQSIRHHEGKELQTPLIWARDG